MNKERRNKTERSKNVGPPSESHTENRKIEDDADCQAALERLLAETPDFVPTRHELLQLVNFWVKEALDYEYFAFLYAQSSSSGFRLSAYAWRRIYRIGELLGEERVKEAVEEAYAKFGKNYYQRDWEIFMHGSSEDRKALQDEIHREMEDYF